MKTSKIRLKRKIKLNKKIIYNRDHNIIPKLDLKLEKIVNAR